MPRYQQRCFTPCACARDNYADNTTRGVALEGSSLTEAFLTLVSETSMKPQLEKLVHDPPSPGDGAVSQLEAAH